MIKDEFVTSNNHALTILVSSLKLILTQAKPLNFHYFFYLVHGPKTSYEAAVLYNNETFDLAPAACTRSKKKHPSKNTARMHLPQLD